MKYKLILMLLILFIAVPAGTAFASPEEVVIDRQISTGYYDIWKHSDGTWQVSGRPGGWYSALADMAFTADRLNELGKEWIITRIEVTGGDFSGNFDKDEYEAAGGWWGVDWDKYFDFYYLYRPKTQVTVQQSVVDLLETQMVQQSIIHDADLRVEITDEMRRAILTYYKGETIPAWVIKMWDKDELKQHAVDLTDSDMRQRYGLPPKTFADNVEGWRVFLPALITWYGIQRAVPDFSVTLDSDSIKADPGDKVEMTATFKLNQNHPQNEKAILKAFHEVNGTEYPVALEPVDPANQLTDHIIQFAPGEVKQYKAKVTAQNVSSKIITKIWPAEAKEDADWSNNKDEAVIQVVPPCTDISVTAYTNKVGVESGESVTVFAKVRRANDGPDGSVPVQVTISGRGQTEKFNVDLAKNGSRMCRATFTVAGDGEVTFRTEAWPQGVEDCRPGNNVATVKAIVSSPPQGQPVQDPGGITVRLID